MSESLRDLLAEYCDLMRYAALAASLQTTLSDVLQWPAEKAEGFRLIFEARQAEETTDGDNQV